MKKTEPPHPAPGPISRQELALLGLILVGAALIGLACLKQFGSSPFSRVPMIDEEAYVKWAEQISSGDWLGQKVFYQEPFFPYLLGLVFYIFGKDLFVVRVIQLILGVAAVAAVYFCARRLAGPRSAAIAALLLAFHHGLHFFDLLILKESLAVFVSALSCLLGVAAAQRPERVWRWLLLGASIGTMCLLRGNFLLLAPALVIVAGWSFAGPTRLRALAMAGCLIGGAVVILPVTARNWRVSGELTLTTSQGGSNFYIGNNDYADGTYVSLYFVRPNPLYQGEDFRVQAEQRTGKKMSDAEASSYWFGEGLRWMRDHPGQAARLLARKAWLLASDFEVANNYSFYLIRREFVSALWVSIIGFGAIFGPALLGAAIGVGRSRRAAYPAAFFVGYAVSLLPFFIVDRYRAPLLPAAAIFAGVAVDWLIAELGRRDFKKLLYFALGVAPLLVAGFYPAGEPAAFQGDGYYLLGVAYLKDQDPVRAMAALDRARRLRPDDDRMLTVWAKAVEAVGAEDAAALMAELKRPNISPEEIVALGDRLAALGREADALRAYELALSQAPDAYPVLTKAADLHARAQDCDPDQAAALLERAGSLLPGYLSQREGLETMVQIAACLHRRGQDQAALPWLQRVLDQLPSHPAALKLFQEITISSAPRP